jgi:hypothetical protein
MRPTTSNSTNNEEGEEMKRRRRRYWFETHHEEVNQTSLATPIPETDLTDSLVSNVLSTARKSILKALFPQRVALESGGDGFNTTIGMLAMF